MSELIGKVSVRPNDIIILNDPESHMDDDMFDAVLLELHERFPGSLVMVMGASQSLQTMTEEEAKGILQAIADHQELRAHKELTE